MDTLTMLEQSARALCATAEKIRQENTKLTRENKKLADQLDDALDRVFELEQALKKTGVK